MKKIASNIKIKKGRKLNKNLFAIAILLMSLSLKAQEKINPALLKGVWSANWISSSEAKQREYGVYFFRKKFQLPEKPDQFIIHISADNRYRLFVNGQPVCSGPARGDLFNWYFESVDISQFLKQGNNVIAAVVWNMGILSPVAQISNQTGFVLQGDGAIENAINTNTSWKVLKDSSYSACSVDNSARLKAYMVIGPGDQVDGKKFPWQWEQLEYNDDSWVQAKNIARPTPLGIGTDNLWTLVPRNIPLMEESKRRLSIVRRVEGITLPHDFLTGNSRLVIPAHKTVKILLDQGQNTVAYPELIVSDGRNGSIKLTYGEALMGDSLTGKGNRNDIEGKQLIGNYDIFLPDGGSHRRFRPLWFRTYRYLQLEITTLDNPFVFEDIYGMYTGYPFKEVACFSSSDPALQKIWETGWRTARLCAGETYFDCPYYEQLQYPGDTRIQALISLYVSGDDRLMRKALLDFYHSRVAEGLTQGRYPSNRLQVIPTYSLVWISMIFDYWMHRKDDAFLRQFLPAIIGVLDWYEGHIDKDQNMLGPMEWWNFVDYTSAFASGVPEGARDGNSSIITLQYAYTLQQAAQLLRYFKRDFEASHYQDIASILSKSCVEKCFDKNRLEMANTPEKMKFSQHAGIMAILTGAIPVQQRKAVMQRIISDPKLGQVTFYWRFYLTQALKKAGLADLYYSQLTPWWHMLNLGLTTFAEKPEPARSDCHAWSASPCYDFLATICGIVPDAPGFQKVLIQPALGELDEVKCNMPHPNGSVKVYLKRKSSGLVGKISLPENVSGRFVWKGKSILLKSGVNQIGF